VWVEVDVRPGLPAFSVVGLGDAAVRESRERVRAAILNSGFEFPARRITANLAPAHLRKVGPGFDVALAVALLAASGQLPVEALERYAIFGELSLSGEVRSVRGTLAIAEGARRAAMRGLIVARGGAAEARLVPGLEVLAVENLKAVVGLLRGEPVPPAVPQPGPAERSAVRCASGLDLADIRGHDAPLQALTIAAAGGHNLYMQGTPGTGKTMLARRLPSIMPPLTAEEALEVTRIQSVAGVRTGEGLVAERPFRAPHHTISASGLVGGGAVPTPGEVTLAHRGVLFLDELPELPRPSLEALRQPLEDGVVAVVRGQRSLTFPARFMLVAASNPCPCGFAGSDRCVCGELEMARYRRRLSGPLLDRLDLLVYVARPNRAELARPAVTSSSECAALVRAARERATHRLVGSGYTCNAEMDARAVGQHVRLTEDASQALELGYERLRLSARGRHRALRVARTIADLAAHEQVERGDMMLALSMRQVETADAAMAA